MTGRSFLSLALAVLGAASCRSISTENASPPNAQPRIASEHVLVEARARVEGESVILEELKVEPRGGARLTEFDLVLFRDKDHSGDPSGSELMFATRNRRDPQPGAEGFFVRVPRHADLMLQVTVATDPGRRERGCWKLPPD